MTTTVETIPTKSRRNTELLLLLFAVAIVLFAWVDTEVANRGAVPAGLVAIGGCPSRPCSTGSAW